VSAPTLPTGHEEYEALAVGWAIAALEPADQDRFEEHRPGCRRCADAVADALDVAVELAYCVPDSEPPPELKGRVLAAAGLAALSVVTTRQVAGSRGEPPPAPVAAPADRVAALSAPDGDRAVATVVLRGGDAAVVTEVLAPNAGRATSYVLWGVPAGGAGAPTALGSFQVTGDGPRSYPVRLVRAPGDYPVLAISEEPAGGLPATPGRVLARGALSR
jgi:hypothetical protein